MRQWLDIPPALPRRSILVRPTPAGLGTPDTESLSSYFSRLAELHGLWPGKHAQLFILPRLRHPTIDSLRQRFAGRSPALGGMQGETQEWVEAISALTLRDDIGATTVRSLHALLAATALLRRGGACPACLRERRDAGLVYESLAWLLAPVSACPRHSLRLLTSCASCGRELVSLAWRSRPGCCPRCGQFLGDQVAQPLQDDHALWIATEAGRLVSLLPELEAGRIPAPTARGVVRAIVAAAGGSAGLRQELNLSPAQISNWTALKARPELGTLLELAGVAGADLIELIRGSQAAVSGPAANPAPLAWRRERRPRIDWTLVAAAFVAEAARPYPCPVLALCRSLGIHAASARPKIPVEYAALKLAARAGRARRSHERRLQLLGAVEGAVAEARARGAAPSRRTVEAHLPKGVLLREEALGDRWRELVRAA